MIQAEFDAHWLDRCSETEEERTADMANTYPHLTEIADKLREARNKLGRWLSQAALGLKERG